MGKRQGPSPNRVEFTGPAPLLHHHILLVYLPLVLFCTLGRAANVTDSLPDEEDEKSRPMIWKRGYFAGGKKTFEAVLPRSFPKTGAGTE